MISIILVILAVSIIILSRSGIVKNPIMLFLAAAIIIGCIAFILKGRVECPFSKICPFHFCPLHK